MFAPTSCVLPTCPGQAAQIHVRAKAGRQLAIAAAMESRLQHDSQADRITYAEFLYTLDSVLVSNEGMKLIVFLPGRSNPKSLYPDLFKSPTLYMHIRTNT